MDYRVEQFCLTTDARKGNWDFSAESDDLAKELVQQVLRRSPPKKFLLYRGTEANKCFLGEYSSTDLHS